MEWVKSKNDDGIFIIKRIKHHSEGTIIYFEGVENGAIIKMQMPEAKMLKKYNVLKEV